MKHTEGKWTVRYSKILLRNIIEIEEPFQVIADIRDKNSLANAKRIVQMNNSFDGLLEACKGMLYGLEDCIDINARGEDKYNSDMLEAKTAIAQAEE